MPNAALIKTGVHIVSAVGVHRVVSQIIRNNTIAVSTLDKVLIGSGSLVLGSMIGQKAHEHVNFVWDELKNNVKIYNNGENESTQNQ